jgi:hypothetical protein
MTYAYVWPESCDVSREYEYPASLLQLKEKHIIRQLEIGHASSEE